MTYKTLFHKQAGLTRRSLFIGAGACASVALSARYVWAQPAEPVSLENYQRVYFNAEEWAFVMAATARLIPSDGKGPGAIETRVPVFIDGQLASPWGRGEHWYREGPFERDAPRYTGYQAAPSPAEAYRMAIPRINQWCVQEYGAVFAALPVEKQDEALARIENDEVPIEEIRSGDFFVFLLQNTKEGYLSDPMYGGNHNMAAWIYIGFPGARASFLQWVGKGNIRYRLGPVSISGERA